MCKRVIGLCSSSLVKCRPTCSNSNVKFLNYFRTDSGGKIPWITCSKSNAFLVPSPAKFSLVKTVPNWQLLLRNYKGLHSWIWEFLSNVSSLRTRCRHINSHLYESRRWRCMPLQRRFFDFARQSTPQALHAAAMNLTHSFQIQIHVIQS